jgi:hypothetical protein
MQFRRKKSHKLSAKAFYSTDDFWNYVDQYAKFILKHKDDIDYYANVDAISEAPEITYKVQRYLEKEYGLDPIPVIHRGEDLKWLHKYLDRGHKYIGIGGIAKRGFTRSDSFLSWGDRVFRTICPPPDYLPIIKTHGFAVTSIPMIRRYPWYSIDSVTWKKMSYFGQILVPPVRNGEYCFTIPPLVIFMDRQSKYTHRKGSGKHFLHLGATVRGQVKTWLKIIGVPWGKRKGNEIVKLGVTNDPGPRCAATIAYFEHLRKDMPKWPWPFLIPNRPTLMEAIQ